MKHLKFARTIIVCITLALITSFSFAATTNWIGGEGPIYLNGPNGWANELNWDNGVPTSADAVTFPAGNYVLTQYLRFEVNDFTLLGGATIVLEQEAVLDIGRRLIVGDGGTTSATIQNYGGIYIHEGGLGEQTCVWLDNGIIDNHHVLYMDMDAAGGIGNLGTISNFGTIAINQLSGNGYGIRVENLFNMGHISLYMREGNGEGIVIDPVSAFINARTGTVDIKTTTLVAIRNTGFYGNNNCVGTHLNGGIVVGTDPCSVFPIDLLSFSAYAAPTGNSLSWKTASELNTAWHTVERSADGGDFWEEAGRLEAAGWSQDVLTYSFMDADPMPVAYYRVRSIDFDGKTALSATIKVERIAVSQAGMGVKVFPQPTNGPCTLELFAPVETEVSLLIADLSGRTIYTEDLGLIVGHNTHFYDFGGSPAGLYLLHISSEQGDQVKKVHVVK